MTEDIKSRDLLKCGEALAQGYLDGIKYPSLSADAADAARRAGEALGRVVNGIGDFIHAMAQFADETFPIFLQAVADYGKEYKAALNEAPPRVRHLALHSKKHRTRKKNINRALREYRRRAKA